MFSNRPVGGDRAIGTLNVIIKRRCKINEHNFVRGTIVLLYFDLQNNIKTIDLEINFSKTRISILLLHFCFSQIVWGKATPFILIKLLNVEALFLLNTDGVKRDGGKFLGGLTFIPATICIIFMVGRKSIVPASAIRK